MILYVRSFDTELLESI